MVIDIKSLIKQIETCLPGMGKSSFEMHDTLLFKDKKIISYNESVAVITPTEFEFSGLVKGQELYQLLKKFGEGTDLKIGDGELIFTFGRAKAKVKILEGSNYGEMFIKDLDIDFQDLTEQDFNEKVKDCIFKNSTILNGVYFTGNTLIATDSSRICVNKLKFSVTEDFWLTNDVLKYVLSFGQIKCLKVRDNWVYFKNDLNQLIVCRKKSANNYPKAPLMEIIGKCYSALGEKVLFPDDLNIILDRFSILTMGSKTPSVTMKIDGSSINFKANSDTLSIEETVLLKRESSVRVQATVDCAFVQWASSHTDSCFLHFDKDSKKKVLLFRKGELLNIVGITEL